MRSIAAASSIVALAFAAVGGVEVGSQLATTTAVVVPTGETDDWAPGLQMETEQNEKST